MESTFAKSLLTPIASAPSMKKVDGVSLEILQSAAVVWNVMGYTKISLEAIGKPTAIATDKAGEIKFRKDGTPSSVVNKEFRTLWSTIKGNVVAGIISDTQQGFETFPDECKGMIAAAQKAAVPLYAAENKLFAETIAARAAAVAEAEAAIRAAADAKAAAAVKEKADAETAVKLAEEQRIKVEGEVEVKKNSRKPVRELANAVA
jgi:hypothetical protein